jgi:hypothetical protein
MRGILTVVGVVGSTSLGNGTLSPTGRYLIEPLVKSLVCLFGNSAVDAAKTQVFLAASKTVHVHGEYWSPVFSWSMRYCGCRSVEITKLAADEGEQGKLWAFCEQVVKRVRDNGD